MENKEEKRMIRVNIFINMFGYRLNNELISKIYDVTSNNEDCGLTTYTGIDINGNKIVSFID